MCASPSFRVFHVRFANNDTLFAWVTLSGCQVSGSHFPLLPCHAATTSHNRGDSHRPWDRPVRACPIVTARGRGRPATGGHGRPAPGGRGRRTSGPATTRRAIAMDDEMHGDTIHLYTRPSTTWRSARRARSGISWSGSKQAAYRVHHEATPGGGTAGNSM
jgi:hypothetical protein